MSQDTAAPSRSSRWREPGLRAPGFTLLELLVSVGILSILATLTMSGLKNAKHYARRLSCVNNVRQVTMACLLYSDSNSKGALAPDSRDTPGRRRDGDDDLSSLDPAGTGGLGVYVCPSNQNLIRADAVETDALTGERYLRDLSYYAGGRAGPGMSYECFGVFGWTTRKTTASVNNYVAKSTKYGLAGRSPGPSQIWLILDGEPGRNALRSGNHGVRGANVGFCDGHAEWIPRKSWNFRYEVSQDEGDVEPDVEQIGE